MEDVTDTVFRELVASTAAPGRLHVLFTEFLSVDGFLHEKGSEKVSHRLYVSPPGKRHAERQRESGWWPRSGVPTRKNSYEASRRISELYDFDGIDINMGCPVKKIVKHNACSALIKFPELAKEIVLATREGSALPVSVKTRIGFNEVETERWIGNLLEVKPAAITVHGRTQKMQSEGQADWNEVLKAVRLRDSMNPETLILGNGDVSDYDDGLGKAASFRADGLMVGRGIFSNPAFFADPQLLNPDERILLLRKHITRFGRNLGGQKELRHPEKVLQDLRSFLRKCHRPQGPAHEHQQLQRGAESFGVPMIIRHL